MLSELFSKGSFSGSSPICGIKVHAACTTPDVLSPPDNVQRGMVKSPALHENLFTQPCQKFTFLLYQHHSASFWSIHHHPSTLFSSITALQLEDWISASARYSQPFAVPGFGLISLLSLTSQLHCPCHLWSDD